MGLFWSVGGKSNLVHTQHRYTNRHEGANKEITVGWIQLRLFIMVIRISFVVRVDIIGSIA